jgi:hypothetical protein
MRGENIMNITLAQSHEWFAIPEEEGESGDSDSYVEARYAMRLC